MPMLIPRRMSAKRTRKSSSNRTISLAPADGTTIQSRAGIARHHPLHHPHQEGSTLSGRCAGIAHHHPLHHPNQEGSTSTLIGRMHQKPLICSPCCLSPPPSAHSQLQALAPYRHHGQSCLWNARGCLLAIGTTGLVVVFHLPHFLLRLMCSQEDHHPLDGWHPIQSSQSGVIYLNAFFVPRSHLSSPRGALLHPLSLPTKSPRKIL